ncbi:uncharacterized protein B0H64DRAFT_138505 [Chaetomium fimeti]|uniref:Uncharacterized protein n=1 Tax=Chaetomium fimeti TaxID=1854472 RepID=A0AAE0HGA7_9PEZI|nr:hypothetical protein B0H64DRAFT_138505 [Chaetomium fimeti]
MTDSGDIAAWAALAAALLALVVALAQATQQYVATAQNMRKCEKSVWGPMPGHAGRRVWVWHQLRFRIVFDMPNIFLPTEYWETPGNARQFPPHRITTLPAPFDRPSPTKGNEIDLEGSGGAVFQNRSEACWVAFARQLSRVCPTAVRVGLMMGDVDRLPADLPVVPMQVSLRDVIALGLMTGMSLQAAGGDFIEMSGPSGFIKSSDHPLLGRLLHFTAFSADLRSTLLKGDINKSWLRRMEGIASVANQPFDKAKRRYYEVIGMRWRTHSTQLPYKPETDSENEAPEEEKILLPFIDLKGVEHKIPADKCESWDALLQTLESESVAKPPFIIRGVDNKAVAPKSWRTLHRVICKGDLKPTFKITQGEYILPRPEAPGAPVTPETKPSDNARDAATKDTANGETDGGNDIELKETPTEMPNEPAGGVAQGTKRSRPRKAPLALTLVAHNKEDPIESAPAPPRRGNQARLFSFLSAGPGPRPQPRAASVTSMSYYSGDSSDDEDDDYLHGPTRYARRVAYDSEEYWRGRMSQAYVSSSTRYCTPSPPVLPFFWASQIDIELGYWATPWARGLYTSCLNALPMMVDVALIGLSYTLASANITSATTTTTTNNTTTTTPKAKAKQPRSTILKNEVIYTSFPDQGVFRLDDLWQRLRAGEHTWPPYAINARGGVTGLEPTTLTKFAAFGENAPLPPLALLQSVHDAAHSPDKGGVSKPLLARDRLVELASLDLWLSCAADTPALAEGEGNLVSNAPAVVEELWLDLGSDIMRTREERWSRDGGDYAVRQLAKRMTAWIERVVRSPAERYFVWVAFLRAVKVMECVQDGPSTYEALGMFKNDILVYLV